MRIKGLWITVVIDVDVDSDGMVMMMMMMNGRKNSRQKKRFSSLLRDGGRVRCQLLLDWAQYAFLGGGDRCRFWSSVN